MALFHFQTKRPMIKILMTFSLFTIGPAWDAFKIQRVQQYYSAPTTREPSFIETGAGVAVIVLIILLIVAAIAVGIVVFMRKFRKQNW